MCRQGTLENAGARPRDVDARFGSEVAALVAALTEDPEIESYETRKAALRRQVAEHGTDAIAVDAADKVAKVRELRARVGRDPSLMGAEHGEARARLKHYVRSLEMLEREQPEHPLVRQLRFELEALRALPPRASTITAEDVRWSLVRRSGVDRGPLVSIRSSGGQRTGR